MKPGFLRIKRNYLFKEFPDPAICAWLHTELFCARHCWRHGLITTGDLEDVKDSYFKHVIFQMFQTSLHCRMSRRETALKHHKMPRDEEKDENEDMWRRHMLTRHAE